MLSRTTKVNRRYRRLAIDNRIFPLAVFVVKMRKGGVGTLLVVVAASERQTPCAFSDFSRLQPAIFFAAKNGYTI
jgi:hypothetical protein